MAITISGFVKLNFDGCSWGGPLGIGGLIIDHSGKVLRAFCKLVG